VGNLKEYNPAKDIISKRLYIETMEIMPNIEKIRPGWQGQRIVCFLPSARASQNPKTGHRR